MPKKFLDQAGLSYFASKYPDNATLETVVNVIGEELDKKVDKEPLIITKTYGPQTTISFETEYEKLPLNSCIININPVQNGSNEPSPDNIRSISGWSTAKVTMTNTVESIQISAIQSGSGNPDLTNIRPITPGLTITRDDSSMLEICSGTLNLANQILTVTHKLLTFDGSETWGIVNNPDNIRYYTITNIGDSHVIGSDIYSHTVYNQNLRTSQASTDVQYGARLYTTTTSGALRLIVCLPDMPDTSAGFKAMLSDWAQEGTPLQVCYQLIEPISYQLSQSESLQVLNALGYTTKQIVINWEDIAGTIYCGTLDITKGTLIVTHGKIIYNGTETWTALGAGYYRQLSSMKLGDNNLETWCDKLPKTNDVSIPGIQFGYEGNTTAYVYIRQAQTLTGATTSTEFKAWLAENPVEIIYPLAEPIIYQVTPQKITMFAGQNTFWANCGTILIKYGTFLQTLQENIEEIDEELNKKANNILATQSTPGLMSALDKMVLDNLNPNIAEHLTPLTNDLYITNAKQENLLECLLRFEPKIGARIRTSNLLNAADYTPGFYIGSGGSNATNANDNLGPFIPVEPGQDIYYTGIVGATTSSSINRRLHVYNANQTWIKQMSFAGGLKVGNSWSTHGVVPSNGAYVRVSWGANDTSVMISVGAPSSYEPYELTPYIPLSTAANPGIVSIYKYTDMTMTTGETYNLEIPAAAGSIYACRINPISGVLISTTGFIDSYNGEELPGLWFSDRDEYAEGTTPSIGAQVVYALAEEDYVEYDLTPVTIPLYYHNNYFQCEEGGIILSFTYYAETLGVNHITLYDGMKFGNTHIIEQDVQNWNNTVESMNSKAPINSPEFTGTPTAPTPGATTNSTRVATTQFVQTKFGNIIVPMESTNKASKNYNAGEYLIYNGQLYKVTTTIVSNTTFSIGTNIIATTVMDEISLLQNEKENKIIKGTITLSSNNWSGNGPYTQIANISGITNNSKIDLQLTATQITGLIADSVTGLTTENNNSILTVYIFGAIPSSDLTIQYIQTEVE